MHYEVVIMHFKVNLFLPFICFILVGCSMVPNEMKIAERIMDTYPDSALNILQHLKPEEHKSASNRALYGLLLFNALEKCDKKIEPDSLINFSINYYLSQNDNLHLTGCYFYKGHMFKHLQRYDEATVLYLKSIDCLQNNKDVGLLGKIYEDLGDISSFQMNYIEASKKYELSLNCFKKVGNRIESGFVLLSLGRTYSFRKNSRAAQVYYRYIISNTNDSILLGSAYQEIGVDFFRNKQSDSAIVYIRKSLSFPFRSNSFAIRNFYLADLLFDKEQIDSSFKYAIISLRYPSNFYMQRDCYRILVNIEYTRKNINQMGIYLKNYQDYTDSIRMVESQTKSSVIENLHNTTQESSGSKRNFVLIASILLIILISSTFLFIYLYKRNKSKREQLDVLKNQLSSKLEFVSKGLTKKIEETKAIQTEIRKNASVDERARLDIELYNTALHLNNWDDFNREMNHAFNNIIVTLNINYPSITRKEIIWCCLNLLEIPHADRMLLLDATSDSLYKLKQRLAQKLNLKSTKDLSSFLKELIAYKD